MATSSYHSYRVENENHRSIKEEPLFKKYFRIFFVVALYWFISISLVFVNKTVLSGQNSDKALEAPLFITCFQCIISAFLYYIISSYKKSNDLKLEFAPMIKVLPLSIVFVAMITLNNLCLKNIGVAFYFVGRSLSTVFNVIVSWLLLKEKTCAKAVACCLVIIFGFLLGVDQESIAGTLFGVLSSLFVCLNAIFTKRVLPHVNQSVWLLGWYNNINAILLFLPLMVMSGELQTIVSFQKIFDFEFWAIMVTGGVFGFSIGYVTVMQIQLTSPLTHNISGTAKACAQTILATYWYDESKSILWWTSNAVVLCGSAAYTRVRQLEMKKMHETESQSLTK